MRRFSGDISRKILSLTYYSLLLTRLGYNFEDSEIEELGKRNTKRVRIMFQTSTDNTIHYLNSGRIPIRSVN
jgi:hypothetical protein